MGGAPRMRVEDGNAAEAKEWDYKGVTCNSAGARDGVDCCCLKRKATELRLAGRSLPGSSSSLARIWCVWPKSLGACALRLCYTAVIFPQLYLSIQSFLQVGLQSQCINCTNHTYTVVHAQDMVCMALFVRYMPRTWCVWPYLLGTCTARLC